MPGMRTGLEKYFGVRIKGRAAGSQTVTTFLTGQELERFVVEPWARGRTVVLNAGQFEPNSYAIEIKPYLGVPKVHENVNQLWRTIIVPDQSGRFLNQAAIDRYAADPETNETAEKTEVGDGAKESGRFKRQWEYVRDHNVWSKVVAQLIGAALIAVFTITLGVVVLKQVNADQSTSTEESPKQGSDRPHESASGVGQLEAGDTVRALLLPDGTYSDMVSAAPGSAVRIAKRLHNVGPDPLPVTVAARVPTRRAETLAVSVEDTSKQAVQGAARHTDAVSIAALGARNICARPIKGSAHLETVGDHGTVSDLADSIFTTGVDVGLIEVGPDAARLAVFDVAITEGTSDGGC